MRFLHGAGVAVVLHVFGFLGVFIGVLVTSSLFACARAVRGAGSRRALLPPALFAAAAALTLAVSGSAQAQTAAPSALTRAPVCTPGQDLKYPNRLAVIPTQGPPRSRVTLRGTGWDPRALRGQGSPDQPPNIFYTDCKPGSAIYLKRVGSTGTGSARCDPCHFTVTMTVPSDAPLGRGAFLVAAPIPVGATVAEADFRVTFLGFPGFPGFPGVPGF